MKLPMLSCFIRFRVSRQGAKVLIVLALLVLTEVLGAPDQSDASETGALRLANGEWPPYTGQQLPGYGCDSQVVTEAFALMGIRVEYSFFPWARGMLLSRNGLVDGALEWENTPEHRRSHFVSRQPISRQQWVFFHRKGTTVDWRQLEDLHRHRIGLTIGYAYSDAFKVFQANYPATFTEAASDLLNFKKLFNRRIDLFPMEQQVGRYLLETYFSAAQRQAVVVHPQPIGDFLPHLLLSRVVAGNERRMQLFEQGLQQLQANGRYRQIMAPCVSANR